jgi:hypothetical protein
VSDCVFRGNGEYGLLVSDAGGSYARNAFHVVMALTGVLTYQFLLDRTGVIVVGYYTQDHSAPQWFGLEVGYRLLYQEPLVETLEIMLAEEQAKGHAAK